MMTFEERVAKYKAEERKETIIKIIVITICIILLAITLLYYFDCSIAAEEGRCPHCGATMEYVGTIVRGSNGYVRTMYRYQCTEHNYHMFDSMVPLH